MSQLRFCRKCGADAIHSRQYEGPRQYQHGDPPAPECIRTTCRSCGYSYTEPCADSKAGSHQGKQG